MSITNGAIRNLLDVRRRTLRGWIDSQRKGIEDHQRAIDEARDQITRWRIELSDLDALLEEPEEQSDDPASVDEITITITIDSDAPFTVETDQ
ncbi:MAG TPA: hypothetical protein VFX15_00170 [Actinomycetes bacterium]|nr:hypothetical protein [Actinomycetes bacterium]